MGEPAEPVIPSGYLTLIPLNGAPGQLAVLFLQKEGTSAHIRCSRMCVQMRG